jgi:chromate reductase
MIAMIAGTNRNDAVSLQIANQYAAMLRDAGAQVDLIDLRALPHDFLHSVLYGNEDKSDSFKELSDVMNRSEKLVFVIPEYNGSFPGVLKVFIDGLDRSKALTDKKCTLVGISAGDQGAGLALSHFTDILNYCGTHVMGYRLRIPGIADKMTDNRLSNPTYLDKMQKQVNKFLAF